MTLITVAIPTHRRDEYLADALDSVLAQTVDELEIFVSDNANSPATQELVRSYADPRITYAPLLENIGMHGNLTRCLHLGSAPYVAVLHDDDVMYATSLERKLAVLEREPTAGVAHSAIDYLDDAGGVWAENVNWTNQPQPSRFETGRQFIERAMAAGNRICTSSALLRRTAIAQLCDDERDGGFSDLGIWLRMALTWDVAFVDEPLTGVRIHRRSASRANGLHETNGDAPTVDRIGGRQMTEAARSAKLRFIDEHAGNVRERLALRHLVRDRARTELKQIVAQETLGARSPALTARDLYRAARIEPSLAWSPWSAVLLASSVLGSRVWETAVEMRSPR